jgi:hypothetical protein
MFTKIKNAFLGRNRMSKKELNDLANYLVCEYKVDQAVAKELAETGEYVKLVEAYRYDKTS